MLLAGEPGIGKTRTSEEFARHARTAGARVLWGPCHEGEGAPAYWPWVQLLRAWLRDAGAAEVVRAAGAGAADLGQLLPEIAGDFSDPQDLSPEQARFRLFDSLAVTLRVAAESEPLLLVLDDLHWADKPSLLLLQFLARALTGARVIIVGTYRHAELRRGHPLLDVLGDLTAGRRIMLHGLDEPDLAQFIEGRVGERPSGELVASVAQLTEGNPFFAGEVVQLLVAQGNADWSAALGGATVVPQGVREVIGRRLDRLSDRCNAVLATAAAIGREFDVGLLQEVDLGGEGAEVSSLVEEAIASRLVIEDPRFRGRYRFSHGLVREALYEEIPAARRVMIHRAIVDGLERRHAADPDPPVAALAHHAFASLAGGDVDRAVRYSSLAGDRSIRTLAYEEAVEHYARGLEALDIVGERDTVRRCDLLIALAAAAQRAGDAPRARDEYLRAGGVAKAIGDPIRLARAAVGGTLLASAYAIGRIGLVDDAMIALQEEALASLPAGDSALRVQLLSRLAISLYFADTAERRDRLTWEAVETAERVGDPIAQVEALDARRFILWGPENVWERLATSTEIRRISERAGYNDGILEGRMWAVGDLLELEDVAQADAEISALARLAAEVRQPYHLAVAELFHAARATMNGRFPEAEAHARHVLELGESQSTNWGLLHAAQMFPLLLEQDRLDEFGREVGTIVAQASAMPAAQIGIAVVLVETGQLDAARAELERLAPDDFSAFPRDLTWLGVLANLAEVIRAVGDAEHAAVVRRLLEPHRQRSIVVGVPAAFCLGPATLYIGMLAAVEGRDEDAVACFEDALSRAARAGARPFVARTEFEYATLLASRGDHASARPRFESAASLAAEIGMRRLARWIDARSEAVGPGRQPHAVLRREGDVWAVGWEAETVRLRDAKGFHYLAALLASPHREVHVTMLAGGDRATMDALGDSGEMLDRTARDAYRSRLDDLRDELLEAERFNDAGRAARAQEEIEALGRELSRAVGLGGRERRASSAVERQRVRVTKGLRTAIARIEESVPALGGHLDRSIRTGYFCVYAPDEEISWGL